MNKVIHYCWFGNKKPDKLAEKCMKSWKKFLPDYEIILWNETNFDVNSTPFSKTAYEQGKWAFVSDVARVFALREYGGIYFDTDMMITKDVSEILENEFFAGWETKHNVAVGVLGVKNSHHPIIEKLYKYYSMNDFDMNDTYSQTIPKLLSNILKNNYNLKNNHRVNQYLNDGVVIYANDYFYPISADRTDNMFTENTCMIHYYNGSWLSNSQRRMNNVYNFLGLNLANIYYEWKYSTKTFIKNSFKLFFYPLIKLRRKQFSKMRFDNELNKFKKYYDEFPQKQQIVFYNPDWMGTSISTKELFDCSCGFPEPCEEGVAEAIADILINDNYSLIAFSAFATGWKDVIESLREKGYKGKIKIIWHGSNCMNVEDYDWTAFSAIFELLRNELVDSLCFVKKSMYEFYKSKGYNVEFLTNSVNINKDLLTPHTKNTADTFIYDENKIKIGVYASGDRWVKNFYNQLCAASMVDNAIVNCSPLSSKSMDFADIIKLDINGSSKPVKREELLYQMSKNDINLYVTFTECAPLVPLESFEMGVPCITGNNHHYWENHELKNYVVVDEADDVIKIYKKIEYCLKNKEQILTLYKDWKAKNIEETCKYVNNFLEIS